MNLRRFIMVLLCTASFSTLAANGDDSGLSTITRQYHKLSVLLQQCTFIYPQASNSYKSHFSKWLIRNRLALKQGERESKKLSAKIGTRMDKSIKKYQIKLKQQYSDFKQMKQDKICGYLPSMMSE